MFKSQRQFCQIEFDIFLGEHNLKSDIAVSSFKAQIDKEMKKNLFW